MKNNKKQNLFKYIKDTTGLSVSKMLLSFIIEPNRITMLNNVALKKIVIEYAPIFEKHRYMLDGPSELDQLACFDLVLMWRIVNKPELKSILGI